MAALLEVGVADVERRSVARVIQSRRLVVFEKQVDFGSPSRGIYAPRDAESVLRGRGEFTHTA